MAGESKMLAILVLSILGSLIIATVWGIVQSDSFDRHDWFGRWIVCWRILERWVAILIVTFPAILAWDRGIFGFFCIGVLALIFVIWLSEPKKSKREPSRSANQSEVRTQSIIMSPEQEFWSEIRWSGWADTWMSQSTIDDIALGVLSEFAGKGLTPSQLVGKTHRRVLEYKYHQDELARR